MILSVPKNLLTSFMMTVTIIHNLNNFLCHFMTFKVATLIILRFLLFCISQIRQKLKQKQKKEKQEQK